MLINVIGGPKEITIEVEHGDTIKVVKEKIFKKLRENNLIAINTTMDNMQLSYSGKRLKNDDTIQSIKIDPEDYITVNKSYFAA